MRWWKRLFRWFDIEELDIVWVSLFDWVVFGLFILFVLVIFLWFDSFCKKLLEMGG